MKKKRQFIPGIKKGMHNFSQNIAIIVNSALLAVVYLIGIGLTSIIAKIFGKQFLELRPSRRVRTYWSDLNLKKTKIDEYYRQF